LGVLRPITQSDGEVVLDEDSVEYAWTTVADLHKYELIQGIDHEIEEVDAILKKRQEG